MGTTQASNFTRPARTDNRSNERKLISLEGTTWKGRRAGSRKGSDSQPPVGGQLRQHLVDLALGGGQVDPFKPFEPFKFQRD